MDLSVILSNSAVYSFMCSRYYKSSVKLYLRLSDFEEYGKPINFDEHNAQFNRFSLIHHIYLESLILSFLCMNVLKNERQCERENLEYNLHEVCGLAMYTWLPFDIDYFPAKQIYLSFQFFGIHHLFAVMGIAAWSAMETVYHVIIRIRHAKHLFLEAINEENYQRQREKFNLAVRYHESVLRLEDLLNETFGVFMFTHLAMTAPILGTGLFGLLHAGSISSLLLAIGWFFGVTVGCLSGQRLENESLSVATTIYNSPWYNCSKDLRRDIFVVLMRCRRPMYLKAASFGIMNHVMLLGILKGSYSYITLLAQ
ncbi:hypothetical protein NQ318_022874 [Aromia moschata]|uniref:Odorant receptor n=1 Tax=Aromia moschata TaxID=1265417 RepID=A0AAV8XIK8_9CUCU|nr:hypothetical protein NQ318_022874 [Aromia moschata]